MVQVRARPVVSFVAFMRLIKINCLFILLHFVCLMGLCVKNQRFFCKGAEVHGSKAVAILFRACVLLQVVLLEAQHESFIVLLFLPLVFSVAAGLFNHVHRLCVHIQPLSQAMRGTTLYIL